MTRKINHGTDHRQQVIGPPLAERELAALSENIQSAHGKLNGLDERVHHVEDDVHELQDEIKGGFDEIVDSLRAIEQYVRELKVNQDVGELRARISELEKKIPQG